MKVRRYYDDNLYDAYECWMIEVWRLSFHIQWRKAR